MTYVVAHPCVDVKDKACIPACPVDCIYELKSDDPAQLVNSDGFTHPVSDNLSNEDKDKLSKMVFIHPEECIDCNACVDPCPVDAIFSEDEVPENWKDFTDLNKRVFGDL